MASSLPFMGWLPLPPTPVARSRSWLAVALALLALAGMAATVVVWRADSADRRGDYARAIRWRPGVGMYHRKLGESLLLTSAGAGEAQLLQALKLNPYDQAAMNDLTISELALGRWSQAVVVTSREGHQQPSFSDYWRQANLFLAHADLQGFWQQLAIAAPLAAPDDFSSIVSRALTASNDDFDSLQRSLPSRSVPAASALLQAAAARRNPEAAQRSFAWLMRLPHSVDPDLDAQRRVAVTAYLQAAYSLWPDQVPTLWQAGWKAGILPGPPKGLNGDRVSDGNFDPAVYAALRQRVPNPQSDLAAIFGWSPSVSAGMHFTEVSTGDPAHPTAAALQFDGTESDAMTVATQSIVTAANQPMRWSASARSLARGLDQSALNGVSLRLLTNAGLKIAELPLPAAAAWSDAVGVLAAGAGVASYQLSLYYQRPAGQLPIKGTVLVSGVKLRTGN